MLARQQESAQQRNMLIALGLSGLVYLSWFFIFEQPRQQERAAYAQEQAQLQQMQAEQQAQAQQNGGLAPASGSEVNSAGQASNLVGSAVKQIIVANNPQERAQIAAASPRVAVTSDTLHGAINLRGGSFDQLTLPGYLQEVNQKDSEVRLLIPDGLSDTYMTSFGWKASSAGIILPNAQTLWSADGNELSPNKPLTLSYDNGQGLVFQRRFEMTGETMIKVTQSVKNSTGQAILFTPYSKITHRGLIGAENTWISFEGILAVDDKGLSKIEAKKFKDYEVGCDYARTPEQIAHCAPLKTEANDLRWLAISEKYWMTAFITPPETYGSAKMTKVKTLGYDDYLLEFMQSPVLVESDQGFVDSNETYVFTGPKRITSLDHYQDLLSIPMFDRAIDFGWFYWITKPFTKLLVMFNNWLDNYGLAILLLTLIVKLIFFPLAHRSYKSMAVMRRLQPKMQEIKERCGDDRQRISQETMELYKREGANPLSGCLPILLQIPVFFALYKTIYISIEMRHAPFFGWITDLSAPDPSSILNLFGLLPYSIPDLGLLSIISIGAWPIIMGLTMWAQQSLSPKPADPQQARIMAFLPLIFTFMLAPFPVGLVIYWSFNNILTAAQQWYILRVTNEEAEAKQAERKKKKSTKKA